MAELGLEEGISVDHCAQCRVAWFDAGELAVMAATSEDLPAIERVSDSGVMSAMRCPRCVGAALTELRYAPGVNVTVATCALCRGVLLSLSDLAVIKATAVSERRASATLALSREDHSLVPGEALEKVARRFKGLTGLAVKQRRRWLEMLTGWEIPNEYAVLRKGMGGAAFHVVEQTAGWGELLRRMFLGPWRPFTAHVEDLSRGSLAMRLVRPWRWFFPELQVLDQDEKLLLVVRRRWSWVTARYEIVDAQGRTIGEVQGRFWRPWTFELSGEGRHMATVKKRWSKLFTEVFSDADNFTVDFDADTPDRWKAIALAATVLIDVVHFESSQR